MRAHCLAVLGLAWLVLPAANARAVTLEYTFTGTVDEVFGGPLIPASLGDPFRLVATFADAPNRCLEPDVCPPPINGIGVRGRFDGVARLEIGASVLEGLPVGAFTYDDYDDLGMRDRFAVGGEILDAGGIRLAGFGVILVTDPPLAPGEEGPLTSEALPGQLALGDWGYAALSFENQAQTGAVSALVTRIEARVVPEPGGLAALGLLVALSARRARVRAAPRSARR